MAEPSIDIEKLVREVMAEMGLAPSKDAARGAAAGHEGDSPIFAARKSERSPRGSGQSPGDSTPVAAGATGGSSASGGQSPADLLAAVPSRLSPGVATPGLGRSDGGVSERDGGELRILARVVTMAELGDRLVGMRRLVVAPSAVVTPAVRDELLRRGVQLVFADPEPAERPGKVRLVTIATGTAFDPAGLLRSLGDEGMETEVKKLDCLIATVDAFVVELAKERTLGLLLTPHTAAAMCLANRVRGVRAVWGIDAAGVARDATAVGANLLVADPAALGAFPLRQLALQFCRLGPQPCPKVFRQRLE